jgi:ABC-type uncharacterized transport system fused permease/ATPase subunit
MICIFIIYTLQIFFNYLMLWVDVRSARHNLRQRVSLKKRQIHPLTEVMIDKYLRYLQDFSNASSCLKGSQKWRGIEADLIELMSLEIFLQILSCFLGLLQSKRSERGVKLNRKLYVEMLCLISSFAVPNL